MNLRNIIQCFLYGNSKVLEVNRLANKIECAAVHGSSYIIHIAVSRNNYCFGKKIQFIELGKQSEAIHFGHVDIAKQHIYRRIMLKLLQGFISIGGKNKLILIFPYFLTELLLYEHLQICFIIGHYNLCHQVFSFNFSFNKLKSTGFVRNSSAPNFIACS